VSPLSRRSAEAPRCSASLNKEAGDGSEENHQGAGLPANSATPGVSDGEAAATASASPSIPARWPRERLPLPLALPAASAGIEPRKREGSYRSH
jgi:hypothetical protein